MRRTKKQIELDSQTYGNLGYAIKKHGIETVRKSVYGGEGQDNERVAMTSWINTRMYRADIQERIKNLSN